MYTIYALVLDNNDIYVGMTTNLDERIKSHKRGKTRSIKNRTIMKVIKIEQCCDGLTARKREKYWKSGCGKEQLKKYRGVEQSGSSSGS